MSHYVIGHGPLLVLIPGIQGRWEWMRPAIQALARRHTVITFSLSDVRVSPLFEGWVSRIDGLLDRVGGRTATVVGVSFGGLVAACYAGKRPERTDRLILVSAPSPSFRLDPQSAWYARHPRLSLPLFASRAARRLLPEVRSAFPHWAGRIGFCAGYAVRGLRFPVSPRHMASIVHEWEHTDLMALTRNIGVPTLIVTGEGGLERVVPVESTMEWLSLIRGARHATIPATGHVGCLSRPEEFAALVTTFGERRPVDLSRADRQERPTCS